MLKKARLFLVMGLIGVMACSAIQSFICPNITTINNIINSEQAIVTAINQDYPNVIPPEDQVIINTAQGVITLAQNIINTTSCPTDAQVAQVQVGATKVAAMCKKAGIMVVKPLK